MGWLPIFVDEPDAKLLIDWLNQEDEIAFLMSVGRGKWKAESSVADLKDGEYSLWHIPSGPLPLGYSNYDQRIIANPWQGWTEPLSDGIQSFGIDVAILDGEGSKLESEIEPLPYKNELYTNPLYTDYLARHDTGSQTRPNSGVNCPGVFWLTLNTRHQPYSKQELTQPSIFDARLMRGKEIISVSDFQWRGNRYSPAPRETQRWWRRLKYWVARQAVRLTPSSVRWSFWAFPSAFGKLKNGMEYYAHGWDLTTALREAEGKTV